MNCEELLAALNEYVDGTTTPGICEEFRRHLEGCNPCQVVVDNIRHTITLYQCGQVIEVPAGCRARLHLALRERWEATHAPPP